MQIIRMYSVFDMKVEAFRQPFFFRTKGEALRAWSDLVNDSQSEINAHPEDYVLYEFGTMDSSTGKMEVHDTPLVVGAARDFLHPDGNVVPEQRKTKVREVN